MKRSQTQKQSDEKVMVAYMLLKIRQRDWHGVGDAAVDLQVMETSTVAQTRQYPTAKRIGAKPRSVKQ